MVVVLLLCVYWNVVVLQVWRVSWNVTGTVLASSGDDGRVRLWKGTNNEMQKFLAS